MTRKVAAKYGMSEGSLRFRMKKNTKGETLSKSGRKPTFNAEDEKDIAACIGVVYKLGFSPTTLGVIEMVADYVKQHVIRCPRFADGKPGRKWLVTFMKRNKLSLKKAVNISAARKAATANLFVIFIFYETLEQEIKRNNLTAYQIWNCDESGFPVDPLKCKVVSVKGEIAYKVSCGARRENITTLAVCSASGQVLDPLIVFAGKNLQSTWRGNKALPNTYYAISESGWMTADVFAKWFNRFCEQVTLRPLLLIFDGHLMHISIPVIEQEIVENIILLKLPRHVTDLLQPLDVACFGPVKENVGERIESPC